AEAISPANLTQSTFVLGISSFQVIMDTAAPSTTTTKPVLNNAYQRLNIGKNGPPNTLLAGTINDVGVYPVGTKDYQLQLTYLSAGDTYYYDGNRFSSGTVTWFTHSNGEGNWSYPQDIHWPNPTSTSFAMKLQVRGE